MADLFDVGVPTVAPSLQISGAGGEGYIELDLQTVGPATPAAGKARIYTNNSGNFTVVTNSGEALSFDVTSLSSARTVTFPDSDGVLVTDDSTATLTNKTLIGGVNGNIVEATSIV